MKKSYFVRAIFILGTALNISSFQESNTWLYMASIGLFILSGLLWWKKQPTTHFFTFGKSFHVYSITPYSDGIYFVGSYDLKIPEVLFLQDTQCNLSEVRGLMNSFKILSIHIDPIETDSKLPFIRARTGQGLDL